jgi:hypothetical protein
MADITRCPRPSVFSAIWASTALLASVPEAVNTTSGGRTPSSAATFSRDSSTALRAACPKLWIEEGLPCRSPIHGSMAARTLGCRGVVAL